MLSTVFEDNLSHFLHTNIQKVYCPTKKKKSLEIKFHRDYGIPEICFGIKSSMLLLKTSSLTLFGNFKELPISLQPDV